MRSRCWWGISRRYYFQEAPSISVSDLPEENRELEHEREHDEVTERSEVRNAHLVVGPSDKYDMSELERPVLSISLFISPTFQESWTDQIRIT